jgi:hypothetical protein
MQPAAVGGYPPLLPPQAQSPAAPMAELPARTPRGGNLLVTLLTVAVGGGIVAGVFFSLLPKLDLGAPAVVEPEGDPKDVFAGSEPTAVPADQKADADGNDEPRKSEPRRLPRSFAQLKTAVTVAGHLPLASLDGGNPSPQTAEICDVGEVEIDVALPTARLSQQRPLVLMCLPDAAAVASGRQAWTFMAAEPGVEPVRFGGAEVRAGTLFVSLESATPATMLPRQAVACGPLRIAARGAGDQATFVQLMRPRECGPIVVRRLLFESTAQSGTVEETMQAAVPQCPWPCGVRLQGRCGDLVGAMTSSRPGPLAGSGTAGTIQWTTAWQPRPGDRPFMDVTMGLTAIDAWQGQPAMVRVHRVASGFRSPWSSTRRLGRIGGRLPATGGLPDAAELQRQIDAVSKVVLNQLAETSVSRLQLSIPKAMTVARELVGAAFPDNQTMAIGQWIDRLGVLLATRPGYRGWANGDAARQTPTPQQVREYLDHLQPAIVTGRADPEEAALASIIADLDSLRTEKNEAIAVVKALGEGDVAFTGQIHADFPDFVPGGTARCVLARFTDGQAGGRRPVPSP